MLSQQLVVVFGNYNYYEYDPKPASGLQESDRYRFVDSNFGKDFRANGQYRHSWPFTERGNQVKFTWNFI